MKCEHTFITKYVTIHVNKEMREAFSEYFIWNFMKNYKNLSYKKVKLRQSNVDFDRLNWI